MCQPQLSLPRWSAAAWESRWRAGLSARVAALAVGAWTLLVLAPLAPPFNPVPDRDAGVFLYVAQQVRVGAVPYRDIWDHKSPGIYYIDALGLAIAPGSSWGVWLLEVLVLVGAALLGLACMRASFGLLPAFVGSIAWISTVPLLLRSGNVVEEYALPLQFAALLLAARYDPRRGYRWTAVAIGAVCAGGILLRTNLVAIPLAVALYIAVVGVTERRWAGLARDLGALAGGLALPLAVVALYFMSQHALGDLADAVGRYNVAYSAASMRDRLTAVLIGFGNIAGTGIGLLGAVAWLGAVVGGSRAALIARPLAAIVVFALPLEIALAAMSGYGYTHYYIAWLPELAVLTALAARQLLRDLRGATIVVRERVQLSTPVLWLAMLLMAMSVLPVWTLSIQAKAGRTGVTSGGMPNVQRQTAESAAYVRQQTTSDAAVLVWGNVVGINFEAERTSPTRFAYQWPLFTRGYRSAALFKAFEDDLRNCPPTLVVDASSFDGAVPPLDDTSASAALTQGNDAWHGALRGVLAFFHANYQRVASVGAMSWPVYRLQAGSLQPGSKCG